MNTTTAAYVLAMWQANDVSFHSLPGGWMTTAEGTRITFPRARIVAGLIFTGPDSTEHTYTFPDGSIVRQIRYGGDSSYVLLPALTAEESADVTLEALYDDTKLTLGDKFFIGGCLFVLACTCWIVLNYPA